MFFLPPPDQTPNPSTPNPTKCLLPNDGCSPPTLAPPLGLPCRRITGAGGGRGRRLTLFPFLGARQAAGLGDSWPPVFLGGGKTFTAVSDVLGGQFVRWAPAKFELACLVWEASLPPRDPRPAAAAAAVPPVWYSGGVEIHLDVEDWFWVSLACFEWIVLEARFFAVNGSSQIQIFLCSAASVSCGFVCCVVRS